MKGKAAPKLVDSANRILYPMKRTHPKGAEDPGWQRISWEEAMSTIAGQLEKFKREGYYVIALVRPEANEQAKEDDSQPVNIMAPHVCPLRLFDYVLFIKD